ncbi:GMC family oxidoreductase [Aquisalinus flavus]|uniref:GMC family oxidoreductase n=1 Tax=Aquisalinus flavus TaxID=1526572 RepID=A0A8J2V7P9_9PROT|nr:GMC family oxidoreductase [Aquisalinus flavus]MBD0425779.1 GMC family oxidoreductase [Aquisalinus flavus]UNE48614.1 GMC family oxidoreductase [Aquisalinus flavus]GGD13371.1 GMC family oxidoreductase [Aquisalinus flavus]
MNAPSGEHDVIVVGSGAGGGMAAWRLAAAGVKVLMLEAGRDYDPYSETPMFNWSREAPLLGGGTPEKDFGYYLASIGGWTLPGEPYVSAEGNEFMWWRSRMLGGRTNHWARNSFRMGPHDFKPYTRDGLGVDWPVSYDEMAPYFDRVEKLIGVYGANDGLENHPDSGPGVLHEPPKPRINELAIKAAANDLGIPCVASRRAVLTKNMGERQACFNATNCGRGCNIGAAFQSTTSLIPWARATGNLEILTNAMVYEVETDRSGKATGVHYIDKISGEHRFIAARVVVLAASACESARILLNSKNAQHPDGVANSSGQVGRNLMDTVGAGIGAQVPALENRPRYNEDGTMGLHLYIPFWDYQRQAAGALDFPRGYHIEIGGQFGEPGIGMGGASGRVDGYGPQVKEDVRRYYGSFIHFSQRGEMIPNEHCYAELDPDQRDAFGIPILRFHYRHTDHEINQTAHFQQNILAIIDRLGGTPTYGTQDDPKDMMAKGGQIIHEVGTARMGDDPATSVLNGSGQSWDVPNLWIMDGAMFASKAHKNPTLTIMALADRSCDHLIEKMRAREI